MHRSAVTISPSRQRDDRRGAQVPDQRFLESPVATSPATWAALDARDVALRLGTCEQGLTAAQAAASRARHGLNLLPRPRKTPWYARLAGEFVHWFAALLWIAAVLAWLAGMPPLALAIVLVIVVNGAFSFWQQYQAERAVEALEALLPRRVMVRRGGREIDLPASDVVPGDVVLLAEGCLVPADARLIRADRLSVDASTLTGESHPVPRTADRVDVAADAATDLANLVFAGTSVVGGRGEAIVYATAGQTRFGRISHLTQQQEERPSPLERQIRRVTRVITVLAVAMGLAFFAVGVSAGALSVADGFLFALGIIVANVPEGLLPTITLALALGVRRMARRNALVKRLEKVETLGATTVILTDKTGTLTENRMTVRAAWTGGDEIDLAGEQGAGAGAAAASSGTAPPFHDLLVAAALCCDARLLPEAGSKGETARFVVKGDPTEGAILLAAAAHGLPPAALAEFPRLAELPFDSRRQRMTTVHELHGRPEVFTKGALDAVLPKCSALRWSAADRPVDVAAQSQIQAAHDRLASRGWRVLAVATRALPPGRAPAGGAAGDALEEGLVLLGLLAMEDPPRPEVPAAIRACRQAGIRTVMVTGDSPVTARAIGREIGMYSDDVRIVTGRELDALGDGDVAELMRQPQLLFARATPEHKLRLVEALQKNDEVVAVTGDGVNDAPALKRADIGVAMGMTGTDVAREAADMVLADDNFASIVAAVEEGRSVFDNIRKFITYIFASNVPEAVPFIAFVLFKIPLPLTVMQILAVDLGTDILPALSLGAERPEAGVMSRGPRPRREPLLNAATLLRAYGWLGVIEAALCMAGYYAAYLLAGWRPGLPMDGTGALYLTATTMSLAGIVACQVGNLLACRSERQSVLQTNWGRNRLIWLGLAAELAILLVLMHAPLLSGVFGLTLLSWRHWALLATFPVVLLVLEELRKAVQRRRRVTR
ncbi:MAG: cation-transporting P-type ATPase [Planctomycetia bacterium]|nr:cation-transporting P-type ATPase [Planctomycetia bacterium]